MCLVWRYSILFSSCWYSIKTEFVYEMTELSQCREFSSRLIFCTAYKIDVVNVTSSDRIFGHTIIIPTGIGIFSVCTRFHCAGVLWNSRLTQKNFISLCHHAEWIGRCMPCVLCHIGTWRSSIFECFGQFWDTSTWRYVLMQKLSIRSLILR